MPAGINPLLIMAADIDSRPLLLLTCKTPLLIMAAEILVTSATYGC
jgi:hypothetical protein